MDSLLYVPGRSLFHRLDPRPKLIFVLSVLIYALLERSTLALLLLLVGLHLLVLSAKDLRAQISPFYKTLAPLLTLLLVLGSLRWRPADPLFVLGPLGVARSAAWQVVGVAARLIALTLAISLLLWSTAPGDAVAGLTRLGIPFTLSMAVMMAVQQIIAFRALFVHILEAQQSRGLVIERQNPLRAMRAYVPVVVPLLINALRQADDLALALQMRGFAARRVRSSRRRLRLTLYDWLFIAVTWGILGLLAQV